MTFGIDISTNQATLDLAAAKTAGAEFVLVKSVASYRPELTVADDYHENIDRVMDAGFGHAKGHYAVPNSKNTPTATAQFQIANVYKRADTDAFMLDNEPIDTYKVYWRDDNAAQYFYTLASLGVRYDQMWFYCPASLTRASGPWPKIEALRKLGLRIVWVSYGDMDATREDGEEPLLGGGITGWDVHQFTSAWTVPGYVGKVDRNYSPHSIKHLFGGGIVPLRNYRLRSPDRVISDDRNDPYVSWQNHLARTSGLRGGVDLIAAVGTPIYARTAGRMIQIPDDGSAGNSCRFYHRDNVGWKDVFSHLSSYRTPKNPNGLNAFDYEAGDIVAYSGNTGGVVQHLHWHLLDVDGIRRNPWDYFDGSAVAGIDPVPIVIEEQNEDTMYPITNAATGQSYTIGRQFIRHERYQPGFDTTTKVLTTDDEPIKLDGTQFNQFISSMGIPVSVVDARGYVLNPHTNVMESGGKWTIGDLIVAEARKRAV